MTKDRVSHNSVNTQQMDLIILSCWELTSAKIVSNWMVFNLHRWKQKRKLIPKLCLLSQHFAQKFYFSKVLKYYLELLFHGCRINLSELSTSFDLWTTRILTVLPRLKQRRIIKLKRFSMAILIEGTYYTRY